MVGDYEAVVNSEKRMMMGLLVIASVEEQEEGMDDWLHVGGEYSGGLLPSIVCERNLKTVDGTEKR